MYNYERQIARSQRMKFPDFERNGRLKHVIFADQFTQPLLDELMQTATMIHELARSPDGAEFLRHLLTHRHAMLYFTQASTRTFLSFTAACQVLGITTAEIRDPAVSSEYKGESAIDSMRMFSSYFDLVIMRTVQPDFAERCAYMMNDLEQFNERSVPVVNGGSGADEHPTQALLDVYTIQRTFRFEDPRDNTNWNRLQELQSRHPALKQGLNDKTYTFCGDIGRGRTIRSLAALLAGYSNISMNFVSPNHPKMRLQSDLRAKLISAGVRIQEFTDVRDALPHSDLLYMTRIQSEHDSVSEAAGIKEAVDQSNCGLELEYLKLLPEYAPILHPFPRNKEIPTSVDEDPRAMYFRQARNGMWVRAALLAHLFDVDGRIASRYASVASDIHNYNTSVLRGS